MRDLIDTIPTSATLRSVGARPLVLWSPGTLRIDGIVDVSSHSFNGVSMPGAAASNSSCPLPGPPGAGGGGGAGGSFGTLGGVGGSSGSKPGGTPTAFSSALTLHGGCPGGDGGASGGEGGGAVYLVAVEAIEIAGSVSASGAGGTPPPSSNLGGSGGGSGGLIGFDAPSIEIVTTGLVLSLGGGGSSGARGGVSPVSGNEGSEPSQLPPYFAPSALKTCAGSAQNLGGAGGTGLSQESGSAGGNGDSAEPCGGGGGGGGSGLVVFETAPTIASDAIVLPVAMLR